jgi:two-component system, OmpR family, response regulator
MIESGEAVLHSHCVQCGRDIVTILSSGARHAVYISVFYFYRLDNEVTKRWLSEHCPGKRLASDDEDRTRLIPRIPGIQEKARPEGRRVLVVDDNPDHLELLAELLSARGYEVIAARDASEALRVILDQKPQACVIDIGLPGIDGYELARKLREIPETRDSRLIAVTGYSTKADTHLFEEAGFEYYFPKPANIEELHQALSKP